MGPHGHRTACTVEGGSPPSKRTVRKQICSLDGQPGNKSESQSPQSRVAHNAHTGRPTGNRGDPGLWRAHAVQPRYPGIRLHYNWRPRIEADCEGPYYQRRSTRVALNIVASEPLRHSSVPVTDRGTKKQVTLNDNLPFG